MLTRTQANLLRALFDLGFWKDGDGDGPPLTLVLLTELSGLKQAQLARTMGDMRKKGLFVRERTKRHATWRANNARCAAAVREYKAAHPRWTYK